MSRLCLIFLMLPLAAGAAGYPIEGGGPSRSYDATMIQAKGGPLSKRWDRAIKPTEMYSTGIVTVGNVVGVTQALIPDYGRPFGEPILTEQLAVQAFQTGIIAARRDTGVQAWDAADRCLSRLSPPSYDESRGLIYELHFNGRLKARRAADGAELWSFDDSGDSLNASAASPLVIPGFLVIDRAGPGLAALDPDSRLLRWKFDVAPAQALNTPAFRDGRLYLSGTRGQLSCLDSATGSPHWSLQGGEAYVGPPALGSSLLFLRTSGGSIEARRMTDGSLVWSLPHRAGSAALSVSGEILIAPGPDRALRAFAQADGSLIWERLFHGPNYRLSCGQVVPADWLPLEFSAPLVSCGAVYLATSDGFYYSLDGQSGATLSQFYGGSAREPGDWSAADGQAFIAHAGGRLLRFDAAALAACSGPLLAATVTPSSTITPSATRTATRSATVTRTWSVTRTATITRTFSASPTHSATPTASETSSASPSSTATPSSTPSFSESTTPSSTPTVSPTFSASPSFTVSPTEAPTKDFQVTPQSTPAWKGSPQIKSALASPNPQSNSCARKIQAEVPGGVEKVEVQVFSSGYSPEARWSVSHPASVGDWVSVDFPPELRLSQGLHFFKLTATRSGLKAERTGRVMVLE